MCLFPSFSGWGLRHREGSPLASFLNHPFQVLIVTFTFQGGASGCPEGSEVSLRPQVSPQNPEVIRQLCVAPVAKGHTSRCLSHEQQIFALHVWSWQRGRAWRGARQAT